MASNERDAAELHFFSVLRSSAQQGHSFLLNHEKRPPSLLWELDAPVAQERHPGGSEKEKPDLSDLERVRIAYLHD